MDETGGADDAVDEEADIVVVVEKVGAAAAGVKSAIKRKAGSRAGSEPCMPARRVTFSLQCGHVGDSVNRGGTSTQLHNFQPDFTVAIYTHEEKAFYLGENMLLTPATEPFSETTYHQ